MRNVAFAALAALALTALAACSQDGPRGDPLKGGDAPPPSVGGPVGADGLPPGHPPMLPPTHPPMDAPTQKVGPVGGLPPVAFAWSIPEGWKESTPSSGMRMAQFDLPGTWADGGAVQCVVFTAMGGGKKGNLDRWAGQVGGAKGDPKITESKVGDMTVTKIEVRGSFADGMTKPPKSVEDGMLLGAVIEVPGMGETVYTVKLAGPRAVIEPEMAKFDALLASFKPKQ